MEQKKIKSGVLSFVFLFAVSLLVLIAVHQTDQYYDAEFYKSLGEECGLNIENLSSGFRGWLLPYIFSLCHIVGGRTGNFWSYWVLASLTFAFVYTVAFRYIAKMLHFHETDARIAISGVISGILFYIFFRGLMIYTLSDLYAFALALADIILLYMLLKKDQKWYVRIPEAFGLGIGLYGVYNIRTIYLFLLLSSVAVLTVWQIYGKKWMRLLTSLTACFLGMFTCALPQMMLNHRLHGNYSWKVPTYDLFFAQLQAGIGCSRYDTYIGDMAQYGSSVIEFDDKIGEAVLSRCSTGNLTPFQMILSLVFRYPLDMAGIYIRHLLNMLYPIYPNMYVEDITKDKSVLLILFYTVLFIAICNFISFFKLKSERWVWFALIIVPFICILPGQVEIRFSIALHFLIYMYAILGFRDFIGRLKQSKGKYIVAYLAGFALYIAYAGIMLSITKDGIATIN